MPGTYEILWRDASEETGDRIKELERLGLGESQMLI